MHGDVEYLETIEMRNFGLKIIQILELATMFSAFNLLYEWIAQNNRMELFHNVDF